MDAIVDALCVPGARLLYRQGDADHNRLTLQGGDTLDYDYLAITTGPKLAFDEVPGTGPINGHTHSVCTVDHAQTGHEAYEKFCDDPGPVIVGAMPMASCWRRRPAAGSTGCRRRRPSSARRKGAAVRRGFGLRHATASATVMGYPACGRFEPIGGRTAA